MLASLDPPGSPENRRTDIRTCSTTIMASTFMCSLEHKSSRKRGRPRLFDINAVAERAAKAFSSKGLSGTSMDEIASSTGLYRTSLAAAFMDKRGIYMAALAVYRAEGRRRMQSALDRPRVRDALSELLCMSLSTYVGCGGGAPGCFLVSTAVTEAGTDPEIARAVTETLLHIDRSLVERIRRAQEADEMNAAINPEALAQVVSSSLLSLAIRARAGASASELERIVAWTLDLVCGVGSKPSPRNQARFRTRSRDS